MNILTNWFRGVSTKNCILCRYFYFGILICYFGLHVCFEILFSDTTKWSICRSYCQPATMFAWKKCLPKTWWKNQIRGPTISSRDAQTRAKLCTVFSHVKFLHSALAALSSSSGAVLCYFWTNQQLSCFPLTSVNTDGRAADSRNWNIRNKALVYLDWPW